MKVIAVVVTYNRLELLKRNIGCLRQNRPLTGIVVVDNGCTDGTSQWLDTQSDLTVIHQDNVGGSGGFYTGISRAYDMQADWIWCMDDDVFPQSQCLENLLAEAQLHEHVGALAPRRLLEGQPFTNDFTGYDLTNPFASMYKGKLRKHPNVQPAEISGTAFEGPLIKREVVAKIGLPNKDFFIFCDDTDYCLRMVQVGYKILSVPAALMDKQKFFSNDSWAERNRKKKWKRFYQVRNAAYMNHHYGRNWGVRYLRSFIGLAGYVFTVLAVAPFSQAYELKDIGKLWHAYRDGIAERLGKM